MQSETQFSELEGCPLLQSQRSSIWYTSGKLGDLAS